MFIKTNKIFSKEDIESLNSEPLTNVISWRYKAPSALKFMNNLFEENFELAMLLNSSSAIRNLGSPDVIMRGYESSPGAWMFLHQPTSSYLTVFSDGYKKHPSKGTSFELSNLPENLSDAEVLCICKDIIKLIQNGPSQVQEIVVTENNKYDPLGAEQNNIDEENTPSMKP
jgi:hypothetical protein